MKTIKNKLAGIFLIAGGIVATAVTKDATAMPILLIFALAFLLAKEDLFQ